MAEGLQRLPTTSSLGNLTPSEFALKSQNNEGTGAMSV
jgi:hypothetical protein